MKRWPSGETVVVRNIANSDGTATNAIPMIAISDAADSLALSLHPDSDNLENYVVAPGDRAAAVGTAPPSGDRPYIQSRWGPPTIRLYPPENVGPGETSDEFPAE